MKNEKLIVAIISITDEMKIHYPAQYEKMYSDNEVLRKFKNDLYEKLKHRNADDLLTGYDNYVLSANPFLPTLPNLIIFINGAEKTRLQQIKNFNEVQNIAKLPPPATIICNPIELLANAKKERVSDYERTPDEKKAKHQENLAKHQALLTKFTHRIRKIYADENHLCVYPGCQKAGSISQVTSGHGNFYCYKHYREA